MPLSRRSLLATASGAASTLAAGCLDFAAGDGPNGPEGVPTGLTCSNEAFRRFDQPFPEDALEYVSARTDSGVRFELALQGTAESYGSEIRLTLRNLDQEATVEIGSRELIAIQRQTETGWQDLRGTVDGNPPMYPDDTETAGPGGGFTWSVTLLEDAVAATMSADDVEVCPPIGTGTHRFVYWGLPDEVAIGRQFNVVG